MNHIKSLQDSGLISNHITILCVFQILIMLLGPKWDLKKMGTFTVIIKILLKATNMLGGQFNMNMGKQKPRSVATVSTE